MSETIILTSETKDELDIAVANYYTYNQESKTVKATAELYNNRIKEILSENNMSKYTSSEGYKVSVSTTTKPVFNEVQLLEYVKTLNIPGLVKTKEYVDMDVLEDCIYHKQLNAKDLAPFKEDKITTRLTCTAPKVLKEG